MLHPSARRAGTLRPGVAAEITAPLFRLDAALATLAARAEAERAAEAGRIAALEAAVVSLAARLNNQLAALGAAQQGGHAGLLRAVSEARVPDELLDGIMLRLDAGRLQARDGMASINARLAETRDALAPVDARSIEARDTLASLAALSVELRDGVAAMSALLPEAVVLLRSLHLKADSLGVQATALHGKADQAGQDRAALLARADALVRRNLIPAGPDVAVRTDDGYLVVPIEDEGQIAAMVETAGRLEPGTLTVACALAREGGLVIDVGAHVGTFTVPLAQRVGAGGQVIAVEPTPRTAGALRRSLALNALQERVTLHECAAGATTGQVQLHLARLGSHNSLLPLDGEQEGEVEVEMRPLDDLVPAGRPSSVIKIDAEGLELDVLRGAGRVLRESPGAGVIAEFGPAHLARVGVSVTDWLDAFRAQGLVPWEIEERSGRLRPLRETGLDTVFSLNLLWLREPPERYPGLQRA